MQAYAPPRRAAPNIQYSQPASQEQRASFHTHDDRRSPLKHLFPQQATSTPYLSSSLSSIMKDHHHHRQSDTTPFRREQNITTSDRHCHTSLRKPSYHFRLRWPSLLFVPVPDVRVCRYFGNIHPSDVAFCRAVLRRSWRQVS
jgi:hypothetical protein